MEARCSQTNGRSKMHVCNFWNIGLLNTGEYIHYASESVNMLLDNMARVN